MLFDITIGDTTTQYHVSGLNHGTANGMQYTAFTICLVTDEGLKHHKDMIIKGYKYKRLRTCAERFALDFGPCILTF